jgi:FAD/FMN-containing dehydrogenase
VPRTPTENHIPRLARALARDYASAPDVVAYPRDEVDVQAVLDWAGDADATVTPFGGGSSVCGGVESKRNGHKGAVTIDLRQMGKVKEVDKTSRAALIEGGTYGPALEAQLRPHSLTLRHFPQSFEYSTLGGWIATRAPVTVPPDCFSILAPTRYALSLLTDKSSFGCRRTALLCPPVDTGRDCYLECR